MDIVSHGLTGLLLARAASVPMRSATAAAVAGALSPDVDVVAQLWDPFASLFVHRVLTHSLLGGLPLALGAASVVRVAAGGDLWRLAGLAYLGLLSHVALDSFTPFGTVLLWPFDLRRWSVNSLHVIDLTVGAIVVTGLLASWRWRRRAASVARATLVALVAYLLFGIALMRTVEARWVETLERQGTPVTRTAVVPVFPGPWRWLGVAETNDGAVRARFWAWSVATAPRTVEVREPLPVGAPTVEHHPTVSAFLERAGRGRP